MRWHQWFKGILHPCKSTLSFAAKPRSNNRLLDQGHGQFTIQEAAGAGTCQPLFIFVLGGDGRSKKHEIAAVWLSDCSLFYLEGLKPSDVQSDIRVFPRRKRRQAFPAPASADGTSHSANSCGSPDNDWRGHDRLSCPNVLPLAVSRTFCTVCSHNRSLGYTMPPDLNSMPTSRPPSVPGSPLQPQRPRRISLNNADSARPSPPSPRSPSLSSLQAAAAINAGLHRSPSNASPGRNSQGLERRRSSLMNNLTINDPAVPGPGELQQSNGSNSSSPRLGRRSLALNTADPNHQRQPSLGELHQELENEQEAQVNRLLHMIRIQQDQIAQIQRQQQTAQEPSPISSEQTRFPTPPSAIPTPTGTNIIEQSSPRSSSVSGLPHNHGHFNRAHSLSRQSSARLSNAGTNSRGGSPSLRPASGSLGPLTEDFLLGGTRDECAFYQAETQTLTRENQMLKMRIRELGESCYKYISCGNSGSRDYRASGLRHEHVWASRRQQCRRSDTQSGSEFSTS